jgi:hypothetical protein
VTTIGVAVGLLYLSGQLLVGQRSFRTVQQTAHVPSRPAD